MKVCLASHGFLRHVPNHLLQQIISFVGWRKRLRLCQVNKNFKHLVESTPITSNEQDLDERCYNCGYSISITDDVPATALPTIGPLIRHYGIGGVTQACDES